MLLSLYRMLDPKFYGITDPVVRESIKIALHFLISCGLLLYFRKNRFGMALSFVIVLTIGFGKEYLDQFMGILYNRNLGFSWKDIITDLSGCLMAIYVVYFGVLAKKVAPKRRIVTPYIVTSKSAAERVIVSKEEVKKEAELEEVSR